MKKGQWYIVIFGSIVGLALFLRLYLLKQVPGLYPDEAMNATNVLQALETHHFAVFYPDNGGREGLFINLQAFFIWLFGMHQPWVLRLPSALIGTLTVAGFMLMLQELAERAGITKSRALALIGGFLLATSFWHLIFSHIGFRVISAPCLLVWAIWATLVGMRREKANWMIAGGILFGLGLYTYTAFRVMPLLLIPLFLADKSKKRSFRWPLLLSFFVLTLVPLALYFLQNPSDLWGHSAEISIFQNSSPLGTLTHNIWLTIKMFFIEGDSNWRHNFASQPELTWPVGVALIAGLIVIFKKGKIYAQLMFGWFLLALIPVVFSNQALPHALRSLLMLPAFLGIASYGVLWVYDYLQPFIVPRLLQVGGVFLVIVLTAQSVIWLNLWVKAPQTAAAFMVHYVDLANAINARPKNEQKYVVEDVQDLQYCYFPICDQPVMFLTHSATPKEQAAQHITYITREQYDGMQDTGSVSFFFLQ